MLIVDLTHRVVGLGDTKKLAAMHKALDPFEQPFSLDVTRVPLKEARALLAHAEALELPDVATQSDLVSRETMEAP